jgi:hypothetical protein
MSEEIKKPANPVGAPTKYTTDIPDITDIHDLTR